MTLQVKNLPDQFDVTYRHMPAILIRDKMSRPHYFQHLAVALA
jgi:hypothetical protein